MNLFTIPAGISFIDTLTAGIMARYGHDPLLLSEITLLLPTQQLCHKARESFLRQCRGHALLLPLIAPINEVEEAEMLLHVPRGTIPPAASPLQQMMYLARLIYQREKAINISEATQLALELGAFLAEMHREGCNGVDLETLVPEIMQEHWQHTLVLLRLLCHDLPATLAAEGLIDAASRRNHIIAAQCSFWQNHPPKGPIIVAGEMGGNHATTLLLKAICSMPQGVVILPALDHQMERESWHYVNACHPQGTMKKLLEKIGVSQQQVTPWHPTHSNSPREILIREVMRPAEVTDSWQTLSHFSPEGIQGISATHSPSLQQEAAVIACMIRAALEQPGKTVALITAERRLARRVASLLTRWDIQTEDAAGCPLQATESGVFLHLIARVAESNAAPVPLLSLLKHRLAAGDIAPCDFRQHTELLELAVLRGVRVASGLSGIKEALGTMEAVAIYPWFEQLEALFLPFMMLFQQQHAPFETLLTAHLQLAEALASTDAEEGATRLWEGDQGKQVAAFMTALLQTAKGIGIIDTASYGGLFTLLWSGKRYRPARHHPRVFLLSPKDARLQHFDTVILGGLTEGSWPQAASPDPWLNRSMRAAMGLPLPEQAIGQSAYDFAYHLHSPTVILSWSDKIDGMPTVPARWLLRLFTVLESAELRTHLDSTTPWSQWAERLYNCPDATPPLLPPAPTPPVESRPRLLSVTHIERWIRDPYALYASKILKLRALDPIDADPGMAEFGNFIHKALDHFNRIYVSLPEHARYGALLECGHKALKEMINRPAIKHFWLPRFERIAAWIIHFEEERRQGKGGQILSEIEGRIMLGDRENPFILTAKADRLELNSFNEMTIIDYKTGTVPSAKDITLGISPQLTLEALIAERLGFAVIKISSCEVKELLYIRLTGGEEAGEISPVKGDIATLASTAKDGLEALIAAFSKPETPYLCCPWPEKAPSYNDYAHFSRIQEWREGR